MCIPLYNIFRLLFSFQTFFFLSRLIDGRALFISHKQLFLLLLIFVSHLELWWMPLISLTLHCRILRFIAINKRLVDASCHLHCKSFFYFTLFRKKIVWFWFYFSRWGCEVPKTSLSQMQSAKEFLWFFLCAFLCQ